MSFFILFHEYRNTFFLAFNDPNFLSSYRSSHSPLVTLTGFSRFWGFFFVLFTLFVYFYVSEEEEMKENVIEESTEELTEEEEKELLLKNKQETADEDLKAIKSEADLTISQSYRLYFDILKNPFVWDEHFHSFIHL